MTSSNRGPDTFSQLLRNAAPGAVSKLEDNNTIIPQQQQPVIDDNSSNSRIQVMAYKIIEKAFGRPIKLNLVTLDLTLYPVDRQLEQAYFNVSTPIPVINESDGRVIGLDRSNKFDSTVNFVYTHDDTTKVYEVTEKVTPELIDMLSPTNQTTKELETGEPLLIGEIQSSNLEDTPSVIGEIKSKLEKRGLSYHPTHEQLFAVTGSRRRCSSFTCSYCNRVNEAAEQFESANMYFEGASNYYVVGEPAFSDRNKAVHEGQHIKHDILPSLEAVNTVLTLGMVADIDKESRKRKKVRLLCC